ncbi:hypothetical protein K3495_g233 [Podosphaera aphanis]|nr:hypothetical protein K3495_g233 [Podosphaera aphanis]
MSRDSELPSEESRQNDIPSASITEELRSNDRQTCLNIQDFLENTDVMMDFESSVAVTYKSSTAIRLEKWQDWPLWYDQLKIWCQKNEIWDDVNPEADGEQPKEKDVALKHLDESLKSTVGDQFRQHLMGRTTERANLKSLFEQVKPAGASIKTDLKSEYELLKSTPYGKSVNEYFSRWQILGIKCQTREHSIFVTGEEDPSIALHDALQPIHPVTAIFRANRVNDNINAGKPVKLVDEIRAWQTFLQSKGILKFPSKSASAKSAAFSSVSLDNVSLEKLERKSESEISCQSSKPNQSNRPECPCGKFHNISQCNYLKPNRQRPHWWKPNKEIKSKIERYCRNNPEFAKRVQDQVAKWESERKSKGKILENTAASTETSNYFEDENIGAAILSGSASSCSLYSSVILDSGTNVHVINDAVYHRIITSRKATPDD